MIIQYHSLTVFVSKNNSISLDMSEFKSIYQFKFRYSIILTFMLVASRNAEILKLKHITGLSIFFERENFRIKKIYDLHTKRNKNLMVKILIKFASYFFTKNKKPNDLWMRTGQFVSINIISL